jgi:nucleotide-binding universal stress UspA family protein
MNNYKIETILVPIDFSETAEKAMFKAIDLARKVGARLVLVHVTETSVLALPPEMVSVGTIMEKMLKVSKDNLKKLASTIKEEHGLKVDHACYSGDVYHSIIRAAHLYNAELIVMGTHGASGIGEWLFGSNAFSVVNNTTIPVLTINLQSDLNSFKKIIFPFNENLLTLKKTEQVLELARIFDSSILLYGFSRDNKDAIEKSLRQKGAELMKEFSDSGVESELIIETGTNYATGILNYAEKCNADLITIISNRSHNIDKVFKSRPDKKLVNHSEIPVLTVPVDL